MGTSPSPQGRENANWFAARMGHPLPYPPPQDGRPPPPPEGGVPLALLPAGYLATKTDDVFADYWVCESCYRVEKRAPSDDASALAHVADTGHTVHLVHTHRTVYEGVRT